MCFGQGNINEEAISRQYFEKQVEVTQWNGILGQYHVQTKNWEKDDESGTAV